MFLRSVIFPVARETSCEHLLREENGSLVNVLSKKDPADPVGNSGICLVGSREFSAEM